MNKKRFTAEEFARRVGVTPTYLSHIVNGKVTPSTSLSKKIERESSGEVVWHELLDFCHRVVEEKNESK